MTLAWHDGQFVDKSSIAISLGDFGFNRSVTVFELARIYGGVAFRLKDHLERLVNGADIFGIALPISIDEMTQIVAALSAKNRYVQSTVKLFLTAGECRKVNGTSFAACDDFTPHLIIVEDEGHPDHPEAPYGLELYRRGQKLKTVACVRDLPMVKSTNYALGFHAARQQAGKDWDDILFTRSDGSITEATRSNFFCVIDGVLCTAKEGMLHGITRKVVLELAAQLGIRAIERDFTSAHLAQATEAFTTGSFAELVPARQIDNHILPTTMDGPVFSLLRKAFTDYIAEFCASGGH